MECSCIRGNYNFYVEAIDKYTLIYQDLSDWMDEDGYETPTEYEVEVIPPTSSNPIKISMRVGDLNRLSTNEIGSVKDGIYCFKTTSCGESYVRSRAIFPYLECCVKQAWATLGMEKQDEIEEIENHLKLASINAELNNVQQASRELTAAKKKLDNLKCDCTC